MRHGERRYRRGVQLFYVLRWLRLSRGEDVAKIELIIQPPKNEFDLCPLWGYVRISCRKPLRSGFSLFLEVLFQGALVDQDCSHSFQYERFMVGQ